MLKKLLSMTLAALLIVAALSACSAQGAPSSEPSREASTAPSETESETPSATPEPAAEPLKDSVTIGLHTGPTSLDPTIANTNHMFYLFNCVFSTLVSYDADDVIYGDLAQDWTVSDDLLTYTFTIRDGVNFHDGTPVTAEDAAYSIQAQIDAGVLTSNFMYVDTIEADGSTLTIKLTEKDGAFLRTLGNAYILPEAQHRELGVEVFGETLNGSGPFKLESYDAATGNYTLTRNEEYYGELPQLKTINYRVIPDDSTRVIALENGEIDWTDPRLFNYSLVSENSGLTTVLKPSDTRFIMYFNTTQAPFDNAAIRKAIAYGVDHEAVGLVHSDIGNTPDTTYSSPLWGELPEISNTITYDPEKSASILADAGITTPIDIGSILIMSNYQSLAEQIQSDLGNIGINCEIETVDTNTWVTKFVAADYLMTISSVVAGPDPAKAYTTGFLSGSSQNYTKYANAECDALLAELNAALTDEELNTALVNLIEFLNEEVPQLQVFGTSSCFSYNKSLVAPAGVSSSRYLKFSDFYWAE